MREMIPTKSTKEKGDKLPKQKNVQRKSKHIINTVKENTKRKEQLVTRKVSGRLSSDNKNPGLVKIPVRPKASKTTSNKKLEIVFLPEVLKMFFSPTVCKDRPGRVFYYHWLLSYIQ